MKFSERGIIVIRRYYRKTPTCIYPDYSDSFITVRERFLFAYNHLEEPSTLLFLVIFFESLRTFYLLHSISKDLF